MVISQLNSFPWLQSPMRLFQMSRDPISQLLDPLAGVRLAEIYSRYYPFIDFLIYLVVFTGIARATLSKQFSGAPGRLLSLGLGIVLALALSVTEHRMHFNISSFGPFAVVLLLAVAGLMFFQTLLGFGVSHKISASVAFIAIYASIRAFVPSLFDWLVVNLPFLAGLLTLALLIAIGTLIYSIWPKFDYSHSDSSSLRFMPTVAPNIQEAASRTVTAERYSRDICLDDEDIFQRLRQIRKYLPTLLETDEGAHQTIQAIQNVNMKEHQVYERFKKLTEINQAIQQEDVQTLQKLFGEMNKVHKEAIPKLMKSLQAVRQRIELEKTIATIEKKIEQLLEKMALFFRLMIQSVERRDQTLARQSVDGALRMEKMVRDLLSTMSKLEGALKSQFAKAVKTIPKNQRKRKDSSSEAKS